MPHSDALHGKAREILLIGPGEWNYYGPRHRELAAMFGGVANLQSWSGGAPESGYFGMASPDEEVRQSLAELPGNVSIPASVSGLASDSVVNVTQLATIDMARLADPVGALPAYLLAEISAGLRLVLDL